MLYLMIRSWRLKNLYLSLNINMFNIEKHYCTLSAHSETALPKLHPNAPKWRRCLREFRKFMMVSEKNPRTKTRFRSQESILTEARRHLKESPLTIHPFSVLAMYKEIIMLVTWMIYYFSATFYLTLSVEYRVRTIRYILYALKPILAFHIFLTFFTGFHNLADDFVEVRPKAIAKNYILGCFIFDVLFVISPEIGHTYKIFFTIEGILHLLSIVRIQSITKCFRIITLNLDLGNSVHELMCLILTASMLIHYFSVVICSYPNIRLNLGKMSNTSWVVVAGIHPYSNTSGLRKYLICSHKVCAMFLGSCSGMWKARDLDEIIIFIIIILTGMFYMAYVTALVLQMSLSIRSSGNLYKHIFYQISYYCRVRKLPDTLRKRVILFYSSRFKEKYFRESLILSTLSEHLKLELKLHNCRQILKSAWLFQSLSPSIVGRILMQLETLVVLPNDLIKDYKTEENIYFITSGEVAIYTHDGMELSHICDGDYFGELPVLANLKIFDPGELNKKLRFVAVYITELLVMRLDTFKHYVLQTPDALERIIQIAKLRSLLNQERIDRSNRASNMISRKFLSRGVRRRDSRPSYSFYTQKGSSHNFD